MLVDFATIRFSFFFSFFLFYVKFIFKILWKLWEMLRIELNVECSASSFNFCCCYNKCWWWDHQKSLVHSLTYEWTHNNIVNISKYIFSLFVFVSISPFFICFSPHLRQSRWISGSIFLFKFEYYNYFFYLCYFVVFL